MNNQLSYPMKQAVKVALVVCVAMMIESYIQLKPSGWLLLTAFLVCQTPRGTPLSRGLVVCVLVFGVAMLLPPYTMQEAHAKAVGIVVGGVVGILVQAFVLPIDFYYEFSQGVTPLLRALHRFTALFRDKRMMQVDTRAIEQALIEKPYSYPEWVYDVGFNPGLRAGFRYFLVNLERMTEIVFSISYLAHRGVDPELYVDCAQAFNDVMSKNEELLQSLLAYFSDKKMCYLDSEADYTSDVTVLEAELRRLVPVSLELLDMSTDYIVLTALARDLKDMRELLLQLVMTLPS